MGHGYSLLYETLFATRRTQEFNLLEIGLCIGGPELATGSAGRSITEAPSVAMWHEYFPKAHLYGIDISDFSQLQTEWFTFHQADCGDPARLAEVAKLLPQQDVIIDDGSHAAYHQQETFLALFERLKPGGLFVIEDLQWQPATYEGSLPKVPRTDILLSNFIHNGSFSDTGAIDKARWAAIVPTIANVTMFDEDWFYAHRRQFNARRGLTPDQPTIWDHEPGKRWLSPGFLKRTAGRLRSDLAGGEQHSRRPRIKMALIQKA